MLVDVVVQPVPGDDVMLGPNFLTLVHPHALYLK